MICTRCFAIVGWQEARYCPNCGKKTEQPPPQPPTADELTDFAARVEALLPRLGEMQRRLEASQAQAVKRGDAAVVAVARKRLVLLVWTRHRLEERLYSARRRLTDFDQ